MPLCRVWYSLTAGPENLDKAQLGSDLLNALQDFSWKRNYGFGALIEQRLVRQLQEGLSMVELRKSLTLGSPGYLQPQAILFRHQSQSWT